jgi:hypothetical protein
VSHIRSSQSALPVVRIIIPPTDSHSKQILSSVLSHSMIILVTIPVQMTQILLAQRSKGSQSVHASLITLLHIAEDFV